jgi:hypothetical protein
MKSIESTHIIDIDTYTQKRPAYRAQALALKKNRRVEVGPHAAFYFENYDTMWHQVHEMLYIEKGGEEQLIEELEAYNPLIPQGNNLIATVMFEVTDKDERLKFLYTIPQVDKHFVLTINEDQIYGKPTDDIARTTPDGKASSVQFAQFDLNADQIDAFCDTAATVSVAINHKNYTHETTLNLPIRQALIQDLDS